MKKILAVLILLLVIPIALATDAPKWTGHYVNDYANILGNKDILESMLIELEKNTSVEFAIVTLSGIPTDETIETYSYKIFNDWGIGKKKENNGLLLLMTANGKPGSRMRLEVGYGLEGYITDAAAGRMLDAALPYYNEGDYSQAAYTIALEVRKSIDESYGRPFDNIKNLSPAALIRLFPIGLWILVIIISLYNVRPKCPKCGSRNLTSDDDYYICNKCGKKFKKKSALTYYGGLIASGHGGFGGSSGGGGFGGGSSGGGGAGR